MTNTKKVPDTQVINDPDPLSIKAYRKLGRTGFNVSDIGCGPAVITHDKVLKTILDAGVKYIDSAIAYAKKNEILIGNVIKDYDRKSLFISSKYQVRGDTTKEDVITQIRGVLERMKTDYLDCLQMHMVSSSKDLKNEAFHKATNQLKSEGRLRYIGVSCHGSNWFEDPEESIEDLLSNAIEDGRFDVLLLVYNFVQQNMAKPFIEEHKLEDQGAINRSAVRFVLSNDDAHSTLITFRNYNDINNYINISGTKLTEREVALLEHYRNSLGRYYCRHACGLCESFCPEKIPINTIIRYNHYFMAQDRQKYAIEKFYGLPRRDLDNCRNCEGFCEKKLSIWCFHTEFIIRCVAESIAKRLMKISFLNDHNSTIADDGVKIINVFIF